MFGRKKADPVSDREHRGSDQTLTNDPAHASPAQIKRATRTRFIWALISAFLLLLTLSTLVVPCKRRRTEAQALALAGIQGIQMAN